MNIEQKSREIATLIVEMFRPKQYINLFLKKCMSSGPINLLLHIQLVWPQWWSWADVSQQGVDFSKKISKIKIIFNLTMKKRLKKVDFRKFLDSFWGFTLKAVLGIHDHHISSLQLGTRNHEMYSNSFVVNTSLLNYPGLNRSTLGCRWNNEWFRFH